MKKKFRIIFMGTPLFSVPTLKALHEENHDVVLVVTQPDRPKGRGRRITQSPIKETALQLGYDVVQPTSIKTREFVDQLGHYEPDFVIVVAFGQLLPENVLAQARTGAINVHASLLPKYRGPAPIQWAIINGELETGICTILMDKGMDTGDILLSLREPIRADDTAGSLHDRLAKKGANVLTDTLMAYSDNTIQAKPQDHSAATYAPMLAKNDGRVDWEKSAESLEPFIRGVTPWPGAYTFFKEKRLKLFRSRPIAIDISEPPGTVLQTFPDELRVATGNGALCIEEIQGPSGKRLSAKDFLRGFNIPPGTILS
ncbi:MAG: methionyl-tRNA formyltransferase [Desulfobacterales bacterium]